MQRLAPSTTDQLGKEEAEVTAMLKSKGMVINEATPEQIVAATKKMAPYWEEWAKQRGPEAIEALKKVRTALNK